MAKIGLIDVDGHNYPNLPLMKLSAWHKRNGDDVSFYSEFGGHYDRVYCAKVFDFTPDYQYYINADEIIKGGTGYAIHGAGGQTYRKEDDIALPYDVEHIYPDYSLYGITDTAYGFLTRGCPRGCDFCIVAKKEGRNSVKVADLSEFWDGQRNIVLCDPNLIACKERDDLLRQLGETGATIEFNQGVDARMLTVDVCEKMSGLKLKRIHFAWDRYQDKNFVVPKLKLFSEVCGKGMTQRSTVYVLVNFDTTFEQDLERIYTLREIGFLPYVMVYDKEHCEKKYRHLQRWVNNVIIYRVCERFEDYNKYSKENKEEDTQLSLFD